MNGTTAVRIQPAWDDPGAIATVIRGAGPFWPLTNYAASDAEMEALGSQRPQAFVPPWFRQDFARRGEALVEGAGAILHNPHFLDAARALAGDGAVVRPTTVYVNVMAPTPFPFPPHLDVPAFRGFTRDEYPIWLLKVMKTSELFERWRTRIVTAVSWFYDGPGGDFHYWPEGPEGPAAVESPPFVDVAVVADNEATFHGVGPVGPPDARLLGGLTRESRLVRGAGGWEVRDAGGATLAHLDNPPVRTTVSWKADVFADEDAARRADAGEDALDLATVVDVLLAGLRDRGVAATRPRDPLRDRPWIEALATAWRDRAPTIGSSGSAS